ncbi:MULTISPECIES: SRPBCC family protein [Nocardioides]|uniref:SRPBCC family protein n=1 Tax=Nocardioides vastitatis TaxID=2568655 RepID=A0ABW0ZKW5_9ACTN|nr:SRPBCC family protein [Nocardioides sp.]
MTTSTTDTTPTREARIEADPELPTVRITRSFDAPLPLVYRAWTDPELVAQWLGPRSIDMEIETWDLRTGGEYRYTARRDDEELAHFYGSFHKVVPNERITQTWGFDEMPDAVSLETATFTDLGDGRTEVDILSVVFSMEERAAMLASGMEVGINEGYAKLDEILAEQTGSAR